jgi:hypothetical protein
VSRITRKELFIPRWHDDVACAMYNAQCSV